MGVRAIEPSPRERQLEPAEERFVQEVAEGKVIEVRRYRTAHIEQFFTVGCHVQR